MEPRRWEQGMFLISEEGPWLKGRLISLKLTPSMVLSNQASCWQQCEQDQKILVWALTRGLGATNSYADKAR